MTKLKEVFGHFPGVCQVSLKIPSVTNGPYLIETRTGVKPSEDLIKEVEKILGPESWSFGKRIL
jgi:hypothetical protein